MIEIMSYNLAAGVDDATFVAADHRVQTEYAIKQPGLLRRTTAHCSDGSWVTVIHWASEKDEEAAGELWGLDEATTVFGTLLDNAVTKMYEAVGGVLGS